MPFRRIPLVSAFLLLALLVSSPAFAQPSGPAAPLVGADAANVVPGSYIVVMKANAPADAVDRAIAQAGAAAQAPGRTRVTQKYEAALRGFAADLPDPALEALRHNPNVDYIEADQTVTLDATQSPAPSWGLDRIDQRSGTLNNAYYYNRTASNVTAYIIDTGIRTSHSDFGGRATVGTDKVGDGRNGQDCNGHGTHVAGIVGGTKYGVAKGVRLVAVRVLNCSGSGYISGVIAGVDWVTRYHAAKPVANMSLGSGASSSLDTAVANSIYSGVTYAIAAGNSSANACNYSPARVGAAITVGATQKGDSRASYSNYGSCLDIFAPGTSITSDWASSNTAIATISGTSMATPHVAGAAALYLSAHSASPATVRNALVNGATYGYVSNAGSGSPNRLTYSLVP